MERAHALLTFPLLAVYQLFRHPFPDILFLEYGLGVCIIILVQGQHYWKLKLYRLTNKPFDQQTNILFFRIAKQVNVALITLMPVVFYCQRQFSDDFIENTSLFTWAVLANIFAVLEHINYYYVQLSLDNMVDLRYVMKYRKLKTASLQKDLLQNEL